MNKKNYAIVSILVLAAVGISTFASFSLQKTPNPTELSQEELARMVKPSVVRIAQHVTGTYSLPEFKIDLEHLTTTITGQTKNEKLDEYITGTGFAVNPNGYIITNSHVVSKESVKAFLLDDAYTQSFEDAMADYSKEELQKLLENEDKVEAFAKDTLRLLIQNSQFNINTELVVLNPASDKENIKDLMRLGFPAEVISVNDNFLFDEKDVALIKINQSNIPTVKLAGHDDMPTGGTIYILGFPATADFNRRNPVESTFTEGIVSASKFSDAKDFKVFQTNAKVSQGSSGGPMFNKQGEVVGIVTFQTGEWARQAGDSFAFAIPIKLARQVLQEKHIENTLGDYQPNFRAGLNNLKLGHCKEANTALTAARSVNFYFTPERQLDPLIEQCENLIYSGKSVDSWFKSFYSWVKTIQPLAWFVIIGRVLLLIAAMWFIKFNLKRLKKDEADIEELKEMEESRRSFKPPFGPELPLPDEETHSQERHALNLAHPHVATYVKDAREYGLPDEHIKNNLKTAGWPDHEINRAVK